MKHENFLRKAKVMCKRIQDRLNESYKLMEISELRQLKEKAEYLDLIENASTKIKQEA